ncbi:MAG: hypothetical protein CVT72_03720 [Alphaproteobacteria bacterium HGW-Alphaproteobacteria-11]|nr:MAG: hypothetical protein CVT72_03720 [Alphaproteobacteria bacterium HGW-Alphaproteobacteria-11]
MTNRHVQKFPSGEIRVFEGEGDDEMVCVEHIRAAHDKRTGNMIGKRQDQMQPPAEPKVE